MICEAKPRTRLNNLITCLRFPCLDLNTIIDSIKLTLLLWCINNQGAWTLSMISYWCLKMTSNYPTSCLEVRRKQKVNKPIFKGCPRKTICKYQHFNHIVFSCSACLQKDNSLSDNYAIIVRYAVYKAWSLHKGQLTLYDAIVSHHQNGRIVTFKSWSCLQLYVHKNDRHDKKLHSKSVCKLCVFS